MGVLSPLFTLRFDGNLPGWELIELRHASSRWEKFEHVNLSWGKLGQVSLRSNGNMVSVLVGVNLGRVS